MKDNMKQKLFTIVFGHDTKAGKLFDVILLYLIAASVITVIIESVPTIGTFYQQFFWSLEIIFTILFSIEYLIRIYISPKPYKYIFSFWGLLDLVSILPTYLSFLFLGYHYLLVIRVFRLLRVFRILRLSKFNKEAGIILNALKASYYKISLFLLAMFFLTIILGTVMYVLEGGETGFTSIPQSIYWAIVTITTVGYGDIVPATILGKVVSSFIMLLGYAIIAVPTGIMVSAFNKQSYTNTSRCNSCDHINSIEAKYCNNCGNKIKA